MQGSEAEREGCLERSGGRRRYPTAQIAGFAIVPRLTSRDASRPSPLLSGLYRPLPHSDVLCWGSASSRFLEMYLLILTLMFWLPVSLGKRSPPGCRCLGGVPSWCDKGRLISLKIRSCKYVTFRRLGLLGLSWSSEVSRWPFSSRGWRKCGSFWHERLQFPSGATKMPAASTCLDVAVLHDIEVDVPVSGPLDPEVGLPLALEVLGIFCNF